jgi:outer membrane protein assembly factor BamB
MLWEGAAGDNLQVQPAVAGGLVFTGATDGSVHAFEAGGCDAATCTPLWSTSVGAAVRGDPAVSNGTLYVGTTGALVAFGLPDA